MLIRQAVSFIAVRGRKVAWKVMVSRCVKTAQNMKALSKMERKKGQENKYGPKETHTTVAGLTTQ